MNKKELMNLLISRVDDDKKDAFIAELREAKSMDERFAVAKKYGTALTDEEVQAIKDQDVKKISDEELDDAAGGCCNCNCNCTQPSCRCNCSCGG